MKLVSWNVNGIRAILKKGFLTFIQKQKPDIVALQEIKADASQVELEIPGYDVFWNSAVKKKGYSGTAILTKIKPLSVVNELANKKHDGEGRVQRLEFKNFYLVNVYVPNSKRDLSRLAYRQEWDADFLVSLKKLEKKKPVIFCGDLNVAHTENDLTHPRSNRKNHGFTDEERAGFEAFVKAGFVDTFREFEKEKGHYTWWSQLSDCRARNIGWRIDYFLISKSLRPKLKRAWILPEVMGSDHCPVAIELEA